MWKLISVLAMRGENDGHESDSSSGSCDEVQSSGNSSLNLSDEEENLGPQSVQEKNWNHKIRFKQLKL